MVRRNTPNMHPDHRCDYEKVSESSYSLGRFKLWQHSRYQTLSHCPIFLRGATERIGVGGFAPREKCLIGNIAPRL